MVSKDFWIPFVAVTTLTILFSFIPFGLPLSPSMYELVSPFVSSQCYWSGVPINVYLYYKGVTWIQKQKEKRDKQQRIVFLSLGWGWVWPVGVPFLLVIFGLYFCCFRVVVPIEQETEKEEQILIV